MIPELRDILFLDIETVANTHEYETLDERIKTQWARKALFFKKDREQTAEDVYHERAARRAEVVLYAVLPVSVLVLGFLIVGQLVPMLRIFGNMVGGLVNADVM